MSEPIYKAVFSCEGRPDAEVFVHKNGATICYDEDNVVSIRDLPQGHELQTAEALQYIAEIFRLKVADNKSAFVRAWQYQATEAHYMAVDKGFWPEDEERNDAEILCLIHSELSEALEALRKGDPPDKHLEDFGSVEVELADAIIRIMDYSTARGYRVAEAVEAKMKYNANRGHKHGKKF